MNPNTVKRFGIRAAVCLTALAVTGPVFGATDPAVPPAAPAPATAGRAHAAGTRVAGAVGVRSTSITGVAWNADNTPLPGARLRLRDVVIGKIAKLTVADEAGRFTFTDVESGSYVIELVTERGRILAIGNTFAVAPGETVGTFVRVGTKVPWFSGFFGNAAAAIASTAASAGVTAIAPDAKPCSSPSPGCS
ncbi:MAG: Carboxypeptidase regulatory-like domain [Acidobacteriota bacterium]